MPHHLFSRVVNACPSLNFELFVRLMRLILFFLLSSSFRVCQLKMIDAYNVCKQHLIHVNFWVNKSLNWQLWMHYALLCQGKVISGFLLRINTIPTIKMKSSIYEYINIRKFVFFFKKVLDTLFSESPWYEKTISWPGLFQGEYSDALAASTN